MERVFKRKDGSRVRITATLSFDFSGDRKRYWSTHISVCAPGKRTFFGVYNPVGYEYRSLSTKERKQFVREKQLQHATKDEIYEVMLAEWESIKPTIDQI